MEDDVIDLTAPRPPQPAVKRLHSNAFPDAQAEINQLLLQAQQSLASAQARLNRGASIFSGPNAGVPLANAMDVEELPEVIPPRPQLSLPLVAIPPQDTPASRVREVFPDVDAEFLARALADRNNDSTAVIAHFVEKGYEKRRLQSEVSKDKKDYLKINEPVSANYTQASVTYLSNIFDRVPLPHIRTVLATHNGRFAPAYLDLQKQKAQSFVACQLIKKPRAQQIVKKDNDFNDELMWVLQYEYRQKAQADREAALAILRQQKEELYTCPCCGNEEVLLEEMAQCSDAHLFCFDCVKAYVENSVFGSSKTTLTCLDTCGCKAPITDSQLRRALPRELYERVQEHMQQAELCKVGMEDLVSCPWCDYKEILPAEDKVLKCKNPKCLKESCKLCHEENHIPQRCEEVEKKTEGDLRRALEEGMTKALLRDCQKCKAKFFKEEGCNKVTCTQCGTSTCYVCRANIPHAQGYNHFCKCSQTYQQTLDKCEKCGLCHLYVKDTKAADQRLVEEARRAEEERYRREHPEAAAAQLRAPVGGGGPPKKRGRKK